MGEPFFCKVKVHFVFRIIISFIFLFPFIPLYCVGGNPAGLFSVYSVIQLIHTKQTTNEKSNEIHSSLADYAGYHYNIM